MKIGRLMIIVAPPLNGNLVVEEVVRRPPHPPLKFNSGWVSRNRHNTATAQISFLTGTMCNVPFFVPPSTIAFWGSPNTGNLSFRTTDRELVNIFRSFGEVVDCSVPVHRENGKPRGYGFVTLKGVSPKDAIHICR